MFKNEVLSLIFFNTVSTSPQFESHCSRKIFSHLAPYKGIKKKQLYSIYIQHPIFFKINTLTIKKPITKMSLKLQKFLPLIFQLN